MFSAKFFPSSSVFDARSSKGSYAWQSILKARSVVEKGMLWRIGDGNKARFFHNNWIPGDFPTKAVPRNSANLDNSTVFALIDPDTWESNFQLIDCSIAPFIVQKIKAIPLCRTP